MGISLRYRLGIFVAINFLVQSVLVGKAFAVPSDKEAWRSDEHGIIVYKDAVDADTYWFIPKVRFESTADNKTLLRSKTLPNGTKEYTVRIIPYFSKDLKELAAQNISNIRQDSQLKPVIAKSIGISLPDFGYKFASANVTNFEYLDAPRLMRFTLTADDAETFDTLYQDDSGVNVDFTITYDGMMTDKFYNIQVSCKNISDELKIEALPGTGIGGRLKSGVVLGADIEGAFTRSVSNVARNVDIVSKGDLDGMQDMIRRVVNLCFEPVSPSDSYDRYPTRRRTYDDDDASDDRRTTPGRNGTRTTDDDRSIRRGDVIDTGSSSSSRHLVANRTSVLSTEQSLMKELHDSMLIEKDIGPGDGEGDKPDQRQNDGGLLPAIQAQMKFRIKKTMVNDDKQAVAKQISMKDTTSITVIPGYLAANAKKVETVQVSSIAEKQFRATGDNSMAAPLKTGINVKSGEQWTINAAFIFNAKTAYSPYKAKQYAWDSNWSRTDGDLYFRVGSGHWTPVNGRSIIESGVIGGGELQFYVDKSSIFNKIPEKMRKASCMGLCEPMFRIEGLAPEYTVQVSGRRIDVK